MSREQVAKIAGLEQHIRTLEFKLEDADRQNAELREAIVALMEPGTPRVLLARSGIMVMDQKWLNGRPVP